MSAQALLARCIARLPLPDTAFSQQHGVTLGIAELAEWGCNLLGPCRLSGIFIPSAAFRASNLQACRAQ